MPRKTNRQGKSERSLPSAVTMPSSGVPKASKGLMNIADEAIRGLPADAPHSLAEGRVPDADKAGGSLPPASESETPAKGRKVYAAKADDLVPEAGAPKASGRGHVVGATHCFAAPPVADTVTLIRAEHRRRIYWMKQRLRIMGALAAEIRLALGWSINLPAPERKKIEAAALDLVKCNGIGTDWETLITMTKTATEPFVDREKDHAKECERLAETLPVWAAFGEAVRGFGAGSLGVIVGEAGDLGGYANPGKLWKRMGLAVFDGTRQGGLPKNAKAEDWIAHGYNRQRRSRMWNIGDALIKGNRDGEYRTIYLARKQYEIDRDPEIKPIKAHRRAQRYMEKRLLRNLWSAWRAASRSMQPGLRLPPAALSADEAERPAGKGTAPVNRMPGASTPARKVGRPATSRVVPIQSLPGATHKARELAGEKADA